MVSGKEHVILRGDDATNKLRDMVENDSPRTVVVVGGNGFGKSAEVLRIVEELRSKNYQVLALPDYSDNIAALQREIEECSLHRDHANLSTILSDADRVNLLFTEHVNYYLNSYASLPEFELNEVKAIADSSTLNNGWKPNKFYTAPDPFDNIGGTYSRKRRKKTMRKNRK